MTELGNVINHIKYLQYLDNSEQTIYKINKVERKQLNSIKQQVIKEFYMNSQEELLYIA